MPLLNQLIAGGIAAISLGGVAVTAATNPAIKADFTNVQTAMTNKDLGAYKTAEKQLVTDRSAAQNTKIDATTQDQLNTMSDKQAKSKATQDAITNNDYNAFKANASQQMLTRTPDQASFDKLVASNKARTDTMNQISDSIKNNDFNAYKTAVTTGEQNEPAGNDANEKARPAPTDAQIQTQFDKLEAAFKADGTLPNLNMGGRGFGGEAGDNHGGGRGKGNKGGNWSGRGNESSNTLSITASTTQSN